MQLRDYISQRLDEGENQASVEGLQNNVRCNLFEALTLVPDEDLKAEIRVNRKESDGQRLLWLGDRSEPSYSIQG